VRREVQFLFGIERRRVRHVADVEVGDDAEDALVLLLFDLFRRKSLPISGVTR